MEDREIRAALDHHWVASHANDFEAEHQIYREDAVLEMAVRRQLLTVGDAAAASIPRRCSAAVMQGRICTVTAYPRFGQQ